MKNKQLFDKTIGILVNAYFNNVLNYFDCKACAVGNIVAANMGIKLTRENKYYITCNDPNYMGDWADAVRLGEGVIDERGLSQRTTMDEIKSSGYEIEDLAKIEFAFLNGCNSTGSYTATEKQNFNGLMSVCDSLMKIHEANETEINEAKSLFVCIP